MSIETRIEMSSVCVCLTASVCLSVYVCLCLCLFVSFCVCAGVWMRVCSCVFLSDFCGPEARFVIMDKQWLSLSPVCFCF